MIGHGKGFNLKRSWSNVFESVAKSLLHALQDPKVNIAGIRRGDLLRVLDNAAPQRQSRQPRRLRHMGVITRVTGTDRYDLTRAGRAATAAACRITEAASFRPSSDGIF